MTSSRVNRKEMELGFECRPSGFECVWVSSVLYRLSLEKGSIVVSSVTTVIGVLLEDSENRHFVLYPEAWAALLVLERLNYV